MAPQAKPNISKSVARAFAVLELFRAHREPMTAVSIRRELDIPQPSLRALLGNLVELGYLGLSEDRKTFFPTMRIANLGDWIGDQLFAGTDIINLVDDIAAQTGETTSLNIRNDLNLEITHTRTASHPLGLNLRPGIGDVLWRTAAGRTLLGIMADDERERLMLAMIRAERNPKRRKQVQALAPALRDIHSAGWFAGYDVYLEGVGAVCVGTRFGDRRAVIAVAGARQRIEPNEKKILRVIQSNLRRQAQS
jgi:DNA-binding IclR family transcriptional regulator